MVFSFATSHVIRYLVYTDVNVQFTHLVWNSVRNEWLLVNSMATLNAFRMNQWMNAHEWLSKRLKIMNTAKYSGDNVQTHNLRFAFNILFVILWCLKKLNGTINITKRNDTNTPYLVNVDLGLFHSWIVSEYSILIWNSSAFLYIVQRLKYCHCANGVETLATCRFNRKIPMQLCKWTLYACISMANTHAQTTCNCSANIQSMWSW